MEEKCWQEFYCHRCKDGGTYIMVKLNMSLNYTAVIVCPMCSAQHERTIENGKIFDRGKRGSYREEICPPKSACSKEPRTKKMQETKKRNNAVALREGEVIKTSDDLVRDSFMRELWLDYHGGQD
jgi:hypothetical protein